LATMIILCRYKLYYLSHVRVCSVDISSRYLISLKPSPSLIRSSFHELVVIRTTKVRNPAVVVMAEVSCPTTTSITHVVGFLLIIPVNFPGDQGALGSHVPVVESVSREVVMFPAAQDIIGDGVEVVRKVFVAIIEVVTTGKTVLSAGGIASIAVASLISHGSLVTSLPPGPGHTAPVDVLIVQHVRVVDHLVVEVSVVSWRGSYNAPIHVRVGQLSWH